IIFQTHVALDRNEASNAVAREMFASLDNFIDGSTFFQKAAGESILSDTRKRAPKLRLKNNQEGQHADREEFAQDPVDGIQLKKFRDIEKDGEKDQTHQHLHRACAFKESDQIVEKRPDEKDLEGRAPQGEEVFHLFFSED